PARVHRRSQSVQAGQVHAGHPHPDPRARSPGRDTSGFRLDPALEPAGRDRRPARRGPLLGRPVPHREPAARGLLMKVVLFCGGQGLRMREFSGSVPKPMATIGSRPVLWHVMRYYAHFGHRDFVLCLGYRGDVVKEYFLRYDEAVSNDFVLSEGGRSIELLNTDIQDWRITFVDTGPDANIGERLLAVKHHVADQAIFLANYADGLTDAPLSDLIEDFSHRDKVAGFVSVRPPQTFHILSIAANEEVKAITHVRESNTW